MKKLIEWMVEHPNVVPLGLVATIVIAVLYYAWRASKEPPYSDKKPGGTS